MASVFSGGGVAWPGPFAEAILAHSAGHAFCLHLPDARGQSLATANEMDLSLRACPG
jgi:hypothetical protein